MLGPTMLCEDEQLFWRGSTEYSKRADVAYLCYAHSSPIVEYVVSYTQHLIWGYPILSAATLLCT